MGQLPWLPDPGADPAEGAWVNPEHIISIRPHYREQNAGDVVLALELKLTGQPLFTTLYGHYADTVAAKNALTALLGQLGAT